MTRGKKRKKVWIKTKKMLKYYGYWECNDCGAQLQDLDEIKEHIKEHELTETLGNKGPM